MDIDQQNLTLISTMVSQGRLISSLALTQISIVELLTNNLPNLSAEDRVSLLANDKETKKHIRDYSEKIDELKKSLPVPSR